MHQTEQIELLYFLQNFNNSMIDEIEKIYCIFYEINPKDYKTSKLERLNLNFEQIEKKDLDKLSENYKKASASQKQTDQTNKYRY